MWFLVVKVVEKFEVVVRVVGVFSSVFGFSVKCFCVGKGYGRWWRGWG